MRCLILLSMVLMCSGCAGAHGQWYGGGGVGALRAAQP